MASIFDEASSGHARPSREAVKRKQARDQRFNRANARRANWAPEQIAAEEERLRAEVEQMLKDRNDAA